MTRFQALFAAIAMFGTTGAVSSQINPISCEFSPSVVQLGGSVEVRMWNNTPSTAFSSGACDWFEIYYSDANGRPDTTRRVTRLVPCTLQIVITGPGARINPNQPQSWNLRDGPTPVPAGNYWIGSRVRDAMTQALLPTEWFCLTIQAGPNEPTMTPMPNDPPQVGQSNSYSIRVPSQPNALYAVLFSFNANNPIGAVPSLGIDLCVGGIVLDVSSGPPVLDGAGSGTFTFNVPNQAALAQEGFQLQTVVVNNIGPLFLTSTNAVSNSILP